MSQSNADITLLVTPAVTTDGYHLDRFEARLDGEVIATSRQPLLDGARALLRLGHAPETLLTIRHAGKDHESFAPAPIAELAKWTIEETDKRGLRRRPWRPLPDKLRGLVQPSGRGINLEHMLPGARRAAAARATCSATSVGFRLNVEAEAPAPGKDRRSEKLSDEPASTQDSN